MTRRLVLLLDGTWNDADLGDNDTNVVRLREIIDNSLDAQSKLVPMAAAVNDLPAKPVAGRTHNETEYLVFYERGVGTGPLRDRLFGGALGDGLDGNIRRAYKFLSFNYREGDEIFVFGFSRGSYTARSLVGYLAAAGLLRAEQCTAENEEIAWRYYKAATNDRLPGIWHALTPLVHNRPAFRVECVGVFDTVGALGVPLRLLARLNRERYEFHDVALSSITKVNLHAMAIDEHRRPFQATAWRKPKFKSYATLTEQVWFAGSHGDVGGGYHNHWNRETKEFRALDDISLSWMVQRLRHHFPDFPVQTASLCDRNWVPCERHEARSGVYRFWPSALRSIGNEDVRSYGGFYTWPVGCDRHNEQIGEKIHLSALERMMLGDLRRGPYRPQNLLRVRDRIAVPRAMNDDNTMLYDLPIVGWDGEELSAEAAQAVLDRLAKALG